MEKECVSLFEVFRVGSLPKSELSSLSLNDVKSKFTLLVPVEDVNQITNANMLATLPKEGHMIVDKNAYQKLLNEKVETAVKDIKIQSDEKICKALEVVEKERREVAEILKATIQQQRKNLNNLIAQSNASTLDDFVKQLKTTLAEQDQALSILFTSPLFRESEE